MKSSSPANHCDASAAPCPDLRAIAAGRFRVGRDQAFVAEYGERGRTDDAWLLTIPCEFGVICPWGADRLAFSSSGRGAVANRVAALHGVRIEQDADDGITISFDVNRFDEIASIVKPRRKRRLTDNQRRCAKERLSKYAFSAAAQRDFESQMPTKPPLDDAQVVGTGSRAVA